MKIMSALMTALMSALLLAGCANTPPYEPSFKLEVGGNVSSPIQVEFHTASGFAITRPADQASTGEGDVNLGVPGGLPGSDAVDLIRDGLPSNL